MSVNVETRVDAPGQSTHAEAAWELKERVRRQDRVLKQRRGFFMDAYKRATSRLLFEVGTGEQRKDDLVGFVSARRDGYILFLVVAPEARGRGYGKRLVASVADNHRTVTCHARTSNEDALEFYQHIGFDIERRINNYYEDGGDAFYLRLGEDAGLAERLSEFIRR